MTVKRVKKYECGEQVTAACTSTSLNLSYVIYRPDLLHAASAPATDAAATSGSSSFTHKETDGKKQPLLVIRKFLKVLSILFYSFLSSVKKNINHDGSIT